MRRSKGNTVQFVTEHIEQYYVRMRKGLYLFLRENEQEKILIALNNSDEEQEISDKAWRIPPMQGDIRIL